MWFVFMWFEFISNSRSKWVRFHKALLLFQWRTVQHEQARPRHNFIAHNLFEWRTDGLYGKKWEVSKGWCWLVCLFIWEAEWIEREQLLWWSIESFWYVGRDRSSKNFDCRGRAFSSRDFGAEWFTWLWWATSFVNRRRDWFAFLFLNQSHLRCSRSSRPFLIDYLWGEAKLPDWRQKLRALGTFKNYSLLRNVRLHDGVVNGTSGWTVGTRWTTSRPQIKALPIKERLIYSSFTEFNIRSAALPANTINLLFIRISKYPTQVTTTFSTINTGR